MNLYEACKEGNLEIVRELLKDPSIELSCSIIDASLNGHLEIVKELLKDHRVDPSELDNLATVLASENDHLEVVKELLKDPRVDPSNFKNYSLLSIFYGNLYVCKILLKDNVSPSFFDNIKTHDPNPIIVKEFLNYLSKKYFLHFNDHIQFLLNF